MPLLISSSKFPNAAVSNGTRVPGSRGARNRLLALALPALGALSAAPALAAPDLDIAQSTSAPTVAAAAAGPRFTYTIIVVNRGPDPAAGVTVLDPLPAGITFEGALSVNGGGSTLGCLGPAVGTNGTVTCTGTMPSLAGSTITITAGVSQTAMSGPRTNTATVTTTTAEAVPNVYPNSASVQQIVQGAADLGIIKVTSNPTPTAGGAAFSYTLSVTNNGPNDAMGIVVLDPLPPGMIFHNVSVVNNPSLAGWGLTCDGPPTRTNGTVRCTGNLPAPTVAPNPVAVSQTTITIVAQVEADNAAGVRTNTATVKANTPDTVPNVLPNTASIQQTIVVDAPLSVTKAGPATLNPGSTAVYHITVLNGGSTTALNATISDPLPANTRFVSLSGTGPFHSGCSHNGGVPGTVTCAAVDIPTGLSTLDILVKLLPNTPLGPLGNTVTITTAGTGTIAVGTSTTTATVQ